VLLEKLDEYGELYAEATRSLAQIRAKASYDQYVALLKSVDTARAKCDRARTAIDKHAESHGCFAKVVKDSTF
jgi:hypothetical protein